MTQGIPKAVHKSFTMRGEAIVTYQAALLRGEVLLVNNENRSGGNGNSNSNGNSNGNDGGQDGDEGEDEEEDELWEE